VSPVYWMAITAFKLQIEEAAAVPIALLYNFVLDHFIEGLTGVGVVS
jgi:hypothetical protein